MNILVCSFESQHELAHQLWKEGHVIEEYLITSPVNEAELMRLMSWADKVMCQTDDEKKIIAFMEIFNRKIEVVKCTV